MKRLSKLLLLPLAMLLTVSCQTFIDRIGGGGSKIAAVLAMMEDEGYVDIDANNDNDTRQYYEGQLEVKYDLELDVTGFYQGYVMDGIEQTRWAMIVVFSNSTQATSFHNALVGDVTASGYKSVWDTIVLHTASMETYVAFDALKHAATSSSQAASTTSIVMTSTTSVATSVASSVPPTSSATSQDNGDYLTEAQMLTILYDAGYRDIDENNDSGTWSYRESHYYTTYGLSVTVIGFYQGYIPEFTRWMKMEVFWDITMATAVADALNNDVTIDGFIHQEGKIVLHTASPETWALFN